MSLHTARYLLLAVLVSMVMGCGDGGSDTQVFNDDSSPPASVNSLLITETGTDIHEAWICLDQAGEVAAYTFYDKGTVNVSDNVYFGSEYSIRENVPPFHYTWISLDNASVVLQSAPLGLQDVWTNLEFSNDSPGSRLLRAISGAKGQLLCSLEGAQS